MQTGVLEKGVEAMMMLVLGEGSVDLGLDVRKKPKELLKTQMRRQKMSRRHGWNMVAEIIFVTAC